jgi:hypothetical protein
VVNADVPERDYWTVVLGSAAVSQQLATVVAAVSVPVHLRLGLMSGTSLLLLNLLMLLAGKCVCRLWVGGRNGGRGGGDQSRYRGAWLTEGHSCLTFSCHMLKVLVLLAGSHVGDEPAAAQPADASGW